MTSTLKKTAQLKKLKELRRMSAERRLALAKQDLQQKQTLLGAAQAGYETVRNQAYDIRMKRLNAIFGAHSDHGTHQALAINTYFQTDEEIEMARQAVELANKAAADARECVKLEQAKLARKMLQEEKASRLCDSVEAEIRMETARQT